MWVEHPYCELEISLKCSAHLPGTVDHHSMAYVGTGDEAGEMTK